MAPISVRFGVSMILLFLSVSCPITLPFREYHHYLLAHKLQLSRLSLWDLKSKNNKDNMEL